MPGHSLHLPESYEPPLPTGKYYPPIYEKRHRTSDHYRGTKQSARAVSGCFATVDSQVSAYVANSLPSLVSEDDTNRKMQRYKRDMAAQRTTVALDADEKAVSNHDAGTLHLVNGVKQKTYRLPKVSRSCPVSPQLQPQDGSGAVTPLELGAMDENSIKHLGKMLSI